MTSSSLNSQGFSSFSSWQTSVILPKHKSCCGIREKKWRSFSITFRFSRKIYGTETKCKISKSFVYRAFHAKSTRLKPSLIFILFFH